MRTFLSSLLLLLLVPLSGFSQSTVKGTVTEEANALPIPGVNIVIKGTTSGTSTDFDGNYILEVSPGDVIVFSYVGFKTVEITYEGQNPLNVGMAEDAALLDEIVLIGYGSTKKEDATGAVEQVSEEEFNKGAIVSPEQLLSGKSAGVRITSAGGAPGEGSEIRIRGGSSLSGNNSPLIVVDGLPLDQRGVQGVRNQLNAINPNEIEDFVVLKDASATAIYGSRASNGVILITTKKGNTNQPLKLEYDLKASTASVIDKVDVLDATQFRAIAETDPDFNPDFLGNTVTDWQSKIYQTAIGAIHNLTATKGYENFNFRINYNHTSQEGVLKTDLYERNALNLGLTQRFFDGDLKINVTSKGIFDDNVYANTGAIGSAVVFDPTQGVFDPSNTLHGGYFEYLNTNGDRADQLAPRNPVALLEQNNNRARNKRNISNLSIDYKFWFLKELKFNMNMGVDYSELSGKQFVPTNAASNNQDIEFRNFYSGLNRNTLLDFYFEYDHNFEDADLNMDIVAGHSYQEFYVQSDQSITENNQLVVRPTTIDRNALESYFGRASFDWKDRYLLSVSYRQDGSSRFNDDNRWSGFPGVSVGWKAINEDFLADSFFSNFKVRAGWGVTGQQEIGANYGYLGVYSPGLNDARIQFGNEYLNTLRPEEYDEDLKWEETTQYNLAFDFGFLEDRLTATIDMYLKDTDDLLATVPVATGSNLSDLLLTNVGSTRSKGIEVAINGTAIQKEDITWDLGFNVTFQDVEITKLSLGDDPNFFISQGGISGGTGNTIQLWKDGLDPSTFYVYRQVYDSDGKPIEGAYVDVNGDNQITEADKQAYKKATPDAYVGLTSNFTWKNLDFNFTFRGSFGNYVYNNVASNNGTTRTITDAPSNNYPNAHSSVLDTGFQNSQFFSDYYVQRADFVKLDNISVGYLVPGEKLDFRASLTATNIWTITEYDGLDPEISNGIDNNFYPRPQTFVLGLNFSF
ncbi:MAG: SusC/RagA family TonB-linked outer membrane protein [Bacteroidetes bacterium MedPE-SWsnd-G2]|nr:MAG: SusC/RagA family TonB-linked outer membrane protein [Bacteroidetes bacterium MedPE-SWsnd-G2]